MDFSGGDIENTDQSTLDFQRGATVQIAHETLGCTLLPLAIRRIGLGRMVATPEGQRQMERPSIVNWPQFTMPLRCSASL